MLERNYMQVNEFYTANAKLYHDMNHHFDAVYHMLSEGDQQQAKEYIESLRAPRHNAGIKVQSGINVLDAILYEINTRAEEKGVIFKVDCMMLPIDLQIEKKDICSLFANLLENALEASNQEISLQIKRTNRTLFVIVTNDYVVSPIKEKGRWLTRKKEKAKHGWGTQIVEQIARKYDGGVEYDTENGVFTTYVMLSEKE